VLKLKVLRGPQAEKYFDLKAGDNTVGRTDESDIILSSPGISKNHARFTVQGSTCSITDLDSSNGTFVNGIKIRHRILRMGDRISFHDIIVELSNFTGDDLNHGAGPRPFAPPATEMQLSNSPQPAWSENAAFNQSPQFAPLGQNHMQAPIPVAMEPETLIELVQGYVEKVILPGIYKLTELYPVKNVLATFVGLFVLSVTILSTIPMAALTRDGVQKEAQRRAVTVARELAVMSEKAIASGNEANIRTDLAENEDGVTSALVVAQQDGHIIAPLSKAESYSNDQFVSEARKHSNEPYFIDQISSTILGVSVPIHGFSSEMGQQVVVANSIVLYKLDSLNWSATVGLFARILIIALLLGALLYFFIYRMMTHPLVLVTGQLDEALRGEKEIIKIKTDFDVMNKFLENINAAISRMGSSQNSPQLSVAVDRGAEASNLVRIMSDPAFAIDGQGTFLQVNSAFEELTGMRHLTLQGQPLEALQDQALKLNLEDLISNAKNQAGKIVSSSLEISGTNYDIDLQISPDEKHQGAYHYIIGTIKKSGVV
jgi:PAS domain S-box-containing protein